MTVGAPPAKGALAPLIALIERVAEHRTLTDLLAELTRGLNQAAGTDAVSLYIHDAATDRLQYHHIDGPLAMDERARSGIRDLPLEESPAGHVWKTQDPLVVADCRNETRFPRYREAVKHLGPRSAVLMPLRTGRQRIGVIAFLRQKLGEPASEDLELFSLVAKHVAVAVESTLHLSQAECLRKRLEQERDHLRTLREVNNAVVSEIELRKLIAAIGDALRRSVPHEWTGLLLHEPAVDGFRLHALIQPPDRQLAPEGVTSPMTTPWGIAFKSRKPWVASTLPEIVAAHTDEKRMESAKRVGMQSFCAIPLLSRGRALGTLCFGSSREAAFSPETVELLSQITSAVASGVDNALAYREIEKLNQKLSHEKLYLEGEIQNDFQEIVGQSPTIKKVLKSVETVAPTDSTVLIWGETGTGKELVARAIHNLSGRKKGTFIKINCAAIPTGLLESELFGHEKGAFTGALNQRIGRFELADGGTLFLDEVGDIPADLQAKLLRVLQEQEFERLGGNKTIKVDVRLVAATNRDLAQMVADRTFRSDLYFRLNVFPVSLPALRERSGDVELLVRHFVDRCARKMNKKIDSIAAETMEALRAYSWPGNVRELESVCERAVILAQGSTLEIPTTELRAPVPVPSPRVEAAPNGTARPSGPAPQAPAPAEPSSSSTLADIERESILKALQECGWRVGGPKGAAARLGLSRTTLQGKMQRFGIARPG
jgi:formate hydrogenlyase transcriptional activator